MAVTNTSGFITKNNGDNLSLDLRSITHVYSAKVRWKGITILNGTKNVVNANTEASNLSTTFPSLPVSATSFLRHEGTMMAYFRNDSSTVGTAYVTVANGSAYSAFSGYVTINPGTSRWVTASFERLTSAIGESVTATFGVTGDITKVSHTLIAYTYGIAPNYVKSKNPKITVGGESIQHIGEIEYGAVTDWYSIGTVTSWDNASILWENASMSWDNTTSMPLIAKNINAILNEIDGSGVVELEIEYNGEPALPAPARASPSNSFRTTNTSISYIFTLTENTNNSASKYHARVRISKYSVMADPILYESKENQADWECYDTDSGSWIDFPSDGVLPGTQVKLTVTLETSVYYWDVSSYDDYDYGEIGSAWKLKILITVDGLYILEIDSVEYNCFSLSVRETCNGEIGEIAGQLLNLDGTVENTLAYNDEVMVAFNDQSGNTEEFMGRLTDKLPNGKVLDFKAALGGGILAQRIIKEDYSSQDIGQSIADIIDDYCAPLTKTNTDTSTGYTAPLNVNRKTALSVVENIRKNYNLFYFVDKDWDLNLYKESEINTTPGVAVLYGENDTLLEKIYFIDIPKVQKKCQLATHIIVKSATNTYTASITPAPTEDKKVERLVEIDEGDASVCQSVAESLIAKWGREQISISGVIDLNVTLSFKQKIKVIIPEANVSGDYILNSKSHDILNRRTEITLGDIILDDNEILARILDDLGGA